MINLADLLGDEEVNKKVLKYLADHEQAALTEFLARLRERHGSEVVLVSLFGSKVRGDFDEESEGWFINLLTLSGSRPTALAVGIWFRAAFRPRPTRLGFYP